MIIVVVIIIKSINTMNRTTSCTLKLKTHTMFRFKRREAVERQMLLGLRPRTRLNPWARLQAYESTHVGVKYEQNFKVF